MKVPCLPLLWVTILFALFSVRTSSFDGNMDVAKLFQESRSKDPNDPPDKITQLDFHDPSWTPPTWSKPLGRAFQWQKQELNGKLVVPKWPPLKFGLRTAAGIFLAVVAASISSAGGIGGGGLFVPILNLVLQFDSRTSAALSAFMVLGGSIPNVIYCVPRRHPEFGHEPLIDYDIALLLQPNMLLGIGLGVLCNVMFPEWLITAVLASFLSGITFSSCKKAFTHWQAETFLQQSNVEGRIVINPEESNTLPQENGLGSSSRSMATACSNGTEKELCNGTHKEISNGIHSEDIAVEVPSSIVPQQGRESLQEPLLNRNRGKSSAVPLKELAILVLVWISFYLVYILRGGQDKKNFLHIRPCGLGYWLISGLQIPFAVAVTIWMLSRSRNAEKHFNQVSSKGPRCLETFLFSTMALVAGILGGMLGVGGGMLLNPFLLQMGLTPQVTAATCAFMVFFSSSMSVAQFLLLGLAPLEDALFFALTCFISSIFGLIVIQRAITKHGRVSLIIFSVSTVMSISAILMTTFGAIDVWRQYQEGDYMGFRAPC